jgi:hypothetical protein
MTSNVVIMVVIVLAGALDGAVMSMDTGAPSTLPASAEHRIDATFIISLWCAPPTTETTVERYKEIADCGFNVVCYPVDNMWPDVKSNHKILDVCQQTGLKAFIGDARVNGAIPEKPDFEKTLDAVIAEYSTHPALGGYFVKDEANGSEFPRLASVFQYLEKMDPKHIAYANLFPNYCDESRLGGTYEQHVSQFMEQVKPSLVSWDNYELDNKYFDNLEVVRKHCLNNDRPFFQIISGGGYGDPSEAQLRWQTYATLSYGGHGIMYFMYWPYPPYNKDAIINRNGTRNARYEIVKRLNARLQALAPTLLKLKSVGVFHTEPLPYNTVNLVAEAPVKKMDGGAMVLGWLKDAAGGDYVFVVNRSQNEKIKAQLTLDAAVKKAEEISQETGKPQPAVFVADSHLLTADLEAGEGKVFRLAK